MKIVNTDGLVLFGPGSEWLWFMLQFLALATTFYAIYRQLRLQASQGAIEQIKDVKREYESERMLRYRLAIAIGLRDGNRPPGFAAIPILDYWDALGGLARKGHLDASLYYDSVGSYCQAAWADLEPYVQMNRTELGAPDIGEDFEWLAAKLTSMDRRVGRPVVYDQAQNAKFRDNEIKILESQLRVEEALHAVVTTSPTIPAPVSTPDEAPAPATER